MDDDVLCYAVCVCLATQKGLLMIYQGALDWQNHTYLAHVAEKRGYIPSLFKQHPSLSVVNGVANCVHAFGTWVNHASRTHWGHRIDCTGEETLGGSSSSCSHVALCVCLDI